MKDIGNYNEGNSKNNPVKNEEGKLTFNPSLITGLAGALKAYQSETVIEKEAIILRFKDYILEISYKQNGMPIVGVLVKGSGAPEEVLTYREDIKKLEL